MATDDDRPDMEPVPDMPGYYRRRTEYAHHRGGQRSDGLTSVGAHLDRLDTPTVTRRALEAAGPDPALMRAAETITDCIARKLDAASRMAATSSARDLNALISEVIRTGVIEGVTAASIDLAGELDRVKGLLTRACDEWAALVRSDYDGTERVGARLARIEEIRAAAK